MYSGVPRIAIAMRLYAVAYMHWQSLHGLAVRRKSCAGIITVRKQKISAREYTMGMNESTIKAIMQPLNTLTSNCGHSDCKTECGNCFEFEIDSMPHVQHTENTHDSLNSNITLIVDRASV